MATPISSSSSSYWCYRCSHFIILHNPNTLTCPNCNGGFIEQIQQTPPRPSSMYMMRNHQHQPLLRPSLRSPHQNINNNNNNMSMSNPDVVLRGNHDFPHARRFDLYHEDVSGLQPLPPNMAEMVLGSGIERLLDQLTHIDMNGVSRYQPPNPSPSVSKAAIDSLPTVEIQENHLATESHCAVCMESFELGVIACELPCTHIYHTDCILPWLSLRNTCPVCRKELPTNTHNGNNGDSHVDWNGGGGNENVGLSIWRLPGGGFAVGRVGRSGMIHDDDDHEVIPVVYTEMDGGSIGNGGEPRRVTWSTTMEGRRRESDGGGGGRLRKMFRNIFGCFNRGHGIRFSASLSTSSSSSSPDPRFLRNSIGSSSSRSRPMVSNSSLRSRRTWSLDGNGGTRPW